MQLRLEEWTKLLPLVQSALNDALSLRRGNTSPLTTSTSLNPIPPVLTFIRTSTSATVILSDIQRERVLNISSLQFKTVDFRPIVQDSVQSSRERTQKTQFRGVLPKFFKGEFVLVARSNDFTAGEKLSICWRGLHRVIKALSD